MIAGSRQLITTGKPACSATLTVAQATPTSLRWGIMRDGLVVRWMIVGIALIWPSQGSGQIEGMSSQELYDAACARSHGVDGTGVDASRLAFTIATPHLPTAASLHASPISTGSPSPPRGGPIPLRPGPFPSGSAVTCARLIVELRPRPNVTFSRLRASVSRSDCAIRQYGV